MTPAGPDRRLGSRSSGRGDRRTGLTPTASSASDQLTNLRRNLALALETGKPAISLPLG
jgi:hypothetical protein